MKKLSRRYGIILASVVPVICILVSCATTSHPQWVRQHPVDTHYYIGIGIAQKIPGQGDHATRAREMALNEIASNIATSIISESNLQVVQEAGVHRETFIASIASKTKAELEGFELMDTWENSQEFRAYYRLSKALYQENLNRRLKQTAMQVDRFYSEGRKAETAGDIIRALRFYLQAATETGDYWGYGLPKPGSQHNEFVDIETSIRLKTILNGIKLDADPRLVHAGFLEPPGQPVGIKASYVNPFGEKIMLTGLPLMTEIKKGKAAHLKPEPTDKSGNTRLFFQRAESPGFTEVEISADLHELSGTKDALPDHAFYRSLLIPSVTVSLQVLPVLAIIETEELNIGTKPARPVTASVISQDLTAKGWVITNNPNEADFLIRIHASARAGTERMGIHTAFAEGRFSLIRTSDGEEIISLTNSEVNAGGRDYETAGRLALERLAGWFISEVNKGAF
mgnify:CR=1 FL=1